MQVDDAAGGSVTSGRTERGWTRFIPITVIAIGAVAALIFARDYLSFAVLSENYQALETWRDENWLIAVAVYFLLYILAVAFSVPGAVWLSLVGGFLFGPVLGTIIVVTSATIGAFLIFLAARSALGGRLRGKAGGWIERMEEGFRAGEVSYLLIIRLVPIVPFFIANLVPAFLGARVWTYLWTTFVGIIPGAIVYISIGAGLGEELSRGEAPDLGVIFEPHVLLPLLGLAALASLPVVLRALGVIGRS